MNNPVRIVAVAMGIVTVTSTAAFAGDLCITQGTSLVFIGRKFSLPSSNKCKSLTGFDNDTVCSGVACTAADESIVSVYYTCADRQINLFRWFSYNFPLPLPSANVGNANYAELIIGTPASGSSPAGTFQLGPCTKPFVSVP